MYILCIFAADSTRGVYQRKLQRWLQYGPTPDASALESSQVELHVNTEARPTEIASVVEQKPSVFSSRSSNFDVCASNGPTSSSTMMVDDTKAAEAIAAMGTHQIHDTAPNIRMSRSEVLPHVRPFSLTFAECGSGSFSETTNGLSSVNRLMKPKVKPVTNNEPVVSSS